MEKLIEIFESINELLIPMLPTFIILYIIESSRQKININKKIDEINKKLNNNYIIMKHMCEKIENINNIIKQPTTLQKKEDKKSS